MAKSYAGLHCNDAEVRIKSLTITSRFLKSTDDSMIETLSKMSGIRHRTYTDSKTVTKDVAAMTSFTKNEEKVSYTMTTKEEPVISYNDMAFIPPCNSIVFRAGDSPIWNRNETSLPMSWRLFKNTIINPGKEYTLQTIPTLSTAKDFDVRQNQPNFTKMFDKRLKQASKAETAMRYYKEVYGYTDDEFEKLDIDVRADDIMELISSMIHPELDLTVREEDADPNEVLDVEVEQSDITKTAMKNNDVEMAIASDTRIQNFKNADKKIYANKKLSKNDLCSAYGVNHALDAIISDIYYKCRNHFSQDSAYFRVDMQNNLTSPDGIIYIYGQNNAQMAAQMNEASQDPNSRVYADGDVSQDAKNDLVVTDAFYKFLVSFDTEWPFIRGEFARRMAMAQQNGNL